jgi:GGDEF domain-containing protein
VGISIGTATYNADGETLDQLLVAADQAMYRVKSSHKSAKLQPTTAGEPAIPEVEKGGLTTVSVN